MSDTDETPYWTAIPPGELENLGPQTRRLLAAIDKIETLAVTIANQRDDLAERINRARVFASIAVVAILHALDGWDHSPRRLHKNVVHDGIVDALATLREIQRILGDTTNTEAPSSKTLPN